MASLFENYQDIKGDKKRVSLLNGYRGLNDSTNREVMFHLQKRPIINY